MYEMQQKFQNYKKNLKHLFKIWPGDAGYFWLIVFILSQYFLVCVCFFLVINLSTVALDESFNSSNSLS